MAKRPKQRETLEEILASCSDTLFPAEMGRAVVAVDSCDVDGDTPLHVIARRGNDHGVVLLIGAGADVNAVGDMSETPLHVALHQGSLRSVATLLAAGANPDLVSEFGQSARQIAAELGPQYRQLFADR